MQIWFNQRWRGSAIKNYSFIKFMIFRVYVNYSVTMATSRHSLHTIVSPQRWEWKEIDKRQDWISHFTHLSCVGGFWDHKSSCKSLDCFSVESQKRMRSKERGPVCLLVFTCSKNLTDLPSQGNSAWEYCHMSKSQEAKMSTKTSTVTHFWLPLANMMDHLYLMLLSRIKV